MAKAEPKTANPASEYDLVVLGAGAAGLTASLVGAIEGLRVLLIESSAQIGGTSALSGGTLWIPGNYFMTNDVADTDIEQARVYLNSLVGDSSPTSMREAFLANGPAMLRYLREHTGIAFKHCQKHADYHQLSGARSGGRPVEAAVFDGRRLGDDFQYLRPPIKESMVLGGMMVSKADIDQVMPFFNDDTWQFDYAAALHWISLAGRYLIDRLKYPRGTRLTMGNALCASLFHECLKRDVAVLVNATVESIQAVGTAPEHAHQLQVTSAGKKLAVLARQSVIFAGGGFSGNPAIRKDNFPEPTPINTAAFDGANGSSQSLAMSLGAKFGPSREHNAWWVPSSIVPRADGSKGVFPHISMDRAKPGLIAVNRNGQRFTNEGASHHEFATAQFACDAVPCWLICDANFIRRYGLGAVHPDGHSRQQMVNSGYLSQADTLAQLASIIGVDPGGLTRSAQQMTEFAAKGVDSAFGKGADSVSRQNGEPNPQGNNPCLGPITEPPFYAVRVEPTDLGTSRGLLTNEKAQLLDASGNALAGLYACGNDMQSVMGGRCPAPGVSLGPGMTFAYLAALDCVETIE